MDMSWHFDPCVLVCFSTLQPPGTGQAANTARQRNQPHKRDKIWWGEKLHPLPVPLVAGSKGVGLQLCTFLEVRVRRLPACLPCAMPAAILAVP